MQWRATRLLTQQWCAVRWAIIAMVLAAFAPLAAGQLDLNQLLDPGQSDQAPAANPLVDVEAAPKPRTIQDSSSVVEVGAHWSRASIAPGSRSVMAITLRMQPPYHINPDKDRLPDDTRLIPTSVTLSDLPAGITAGIVQYPEPHMVQVRYTGEVESVAALEGEVTLYVPLTVASDVAPGTHVVQASVRYQSCNETVCLFPATTRVRIDVVVDAAADDAMIDDEKAALFAGFDVAKFDAVAKPPAATDSAVTPQPTKSPARRLDAFGYGIDLDGLSWMLVPVLLLAAFIGGLLLNFTPCVLPVIPLKIMSLSKSAGDRTRTIILGTAMSAGVVAFWLGLGVAMSLFSGFQATSQLFGFWWFSLTMGLLIVALAVGMCGLFTISLPQSVYRITPRQDSVGGSMGFGVMTAVLSTPCTGPFMGAAAAAALSLPFVHRIVIFGTIGLGMAAPYFVLSAFPKLVNRMPRTGPASELIKQVMGLLMLAAGAYFIGVGIVALSSDGSSQPSQLYWWPVAACIVAAGGWLVYRTFVVARTTASRATFATLGLMIVASSYFIMPLHEGRAADEEDPLHIAWVYYTPDRFAEAQAQGQVVMLDFTAEWCLNCKLLEATVLRTESVTAVLREPDVVAMKVDLTGTNEAGRALLQDLSAVAIPYLVVFDAKGQPTFRADSYTPAQVVAAIEAGRTVRLVSRQ